MTNRPFLVPKVVVEARKLEGAKQPAKVIQFPARVVIRKAA